ncbi:exopolyphosphatase [Thiohalobacter sp. IOR34]|nr:exopolyphosphatase [Thiohalobacter sp. IOR34]WJW76854.1 exopolyphosphatase [Thiohalobacter sp. IOR34]
MIVAQRQDGRLQVLDRLREPVRLAAGLNAEHRLDAAARERALACLERFGQRLRELPSANVRAVGTNTLRRANRDGAFLEEAQAALGHPIEVISGVEEARLIYQGVAHGIAADDGEQRLVMDIGGGSTELIVGEGFRALDLESLYMGCVGMSRRFFDDGLISKERMREAVLAAQLELKTVRRRFRRLGWSKAIGASGTIKAVREIIRAEGWDDGISAEGLKHLRKALLAAGHVDALRLAGLVEDRRQVLPGGVAILLAAFESLGIERMLVSPGALREGLLYDLLGRIEHSDIREATVLAMARRFQVDQAHAGRVEALALALFDALAGDWGLDPLQWRHWLHWAAQLHEVGLVVAHSQYHKHGAYLVAYSDMPGFSMSEQALLAALVRGHRRKFPRDECPALADPRAEAPRRLCILLRLAVLLLRGRPEDEPPRPRVRAEAGRLWLEFPPGYLDAHPLTRADLKQERKRLAGIDFRLDYR